MSDVIPFSTGANLDGKAEADAKLSIDETFEELQQWRQHRSVHRQSRFPDELWRKILALGKRHGHRKVCQIFGLSARQYHDKEAEYLGLSSTSTVPPTPVSSAQAPTPSFQWCEAKPAPSALEEDDESGPVPLMTHTVVVEFRRADGQLMKIHTTTDRFHELLAAFFQGR